MTDTDIIEKYEHRAAWLEYVDGREREDAESEARRRLIEDEGCDARRVLELTGDG